MMEEREKVLFFIVFNHKNSYFNTFIMIHSLHKFAVPV